MLSCAYSRQVCELYLMIQNQHVDQDVDLILIEMSVNDIFMYVSGSTGHFLGSALFSSARGGGPLDEYLIK